MTTEKHKAEEKDEQTYKGARKQIQRINDRIAKTLIDLFNHPRNYNNSQIAMKVDLSSRTVYRARNQYYETGNIRSTQNRRKSIGLSIKHKSIVQIASQQLEKNPYQTMSCLCRQLQKNNIFVSRTTVSRILKRQRFSYKKLTYIPFSRNTDTVIKARYDYCLEISKISDQNLYFTDQTSFNLKTAPNYGWAKKGQQVSLKIADNAGETISVLAIINIKGLLSFSIIKGTAKTQNIQNNFKDNALPNIKDNAVLIMDNVRSHRSFEIMNFINSSGLKVKYLPPYSPQLNPIENLFGTIKAQFRRLRVQRQVRTTHQLISTIKQVFEKQYGVQLSNYYRKMRQYVQVGLKNLPFDKNL